MCVCVRARAATAAGRRQTDKSLKPSGHAEERTAPRRDYTTVIFLQPFEKPSCIYIIIIIIFFLSKRRTAAAAVGRVHTHTQRSLKQVVKIIDIT